MTRRKHIVGVLFCLVLLGFAELFSYFAIYAVAPFLDGEIRTARSIFGEQSQRIRALFENQDSALGVVDSELGWRYRPGFRNASDEINRMGLRSSRSYTPLPEEGILRIAVFGDSFVYGTEVDNNFAWPALMEERYGDMEVLNYGVGGYGVDQALLRFRLEGSRLSPHVVLIGFAPIDLRRVVNVYRRFLSSNETLLTKPRFDLGPEGRLRLIPTPIGAVGDWAPILENPSLVTEWGIHDQWYEPLIYENPLHDLSALVRLGSAVWIRLDNRYLDDNRVYDGDQFNPASMAFNIQLEIFETFVNEVQAGGAYPIILILPSSESLEAISLGRRPQYAPLLDGIKELGLPVLEAAEAFVVHDGSQIDGWFASGGHYNAVGTRAIADWLGAYFERNRDTLGAW